MCSFFRREQLSSSIGLTCGQTVKEKNLFVGCWGDAPKLSSSKFSVHNIWYFTTHRNSTFSYKLQWLCLVMILGSRVIVWQNQSPSLEWTSQQCCLAFCLSTSCPSSVLETSAPQHMCAGTGDSWQSRYNEPVQMCISFIRYQASITFLSNIITENLWKFNFRMLPEMSKTCLLTHSVISMWFQDCLWSPKCIRLGWFLPYSPSDHEYGAWKRHYVACTASLDILTAREAADVYGTLNESLTAPEEQEDRWREHKIRQTIREKIAEHKSKYQGFQHCL